MREVKEKSPLKERAAKTLKSAPQAAFRRGTDASFEQLRQELREAAQDGKSDDRYESGKITDTADHAVQEAHQKLSTSCRKQNPNRSGKPGQNLFHNMSSLGTPCSLLRHRGNIHRKASHREISLCANRLLQSGRSRFLRQATSSLLVYRRSLR